MTTTVSTTIKVVVSMVVVAALVATTFNSKVRTMHENWLSYWGYGLKNPIEPNGLTSRWMDLPVDVYETSVQLFYAVWHSRNCSNVYNFYFFCSRCTSQISTGLKGSRKLQFGGITLASSQGVANTGSAVTTGVFGTTPVLGGTGASFGTGEAVGTSNGFIQSQNGQAFSSGTSGGNSTSANMLTVLSTPTTGGGGLSGGTLSSVGLGQGAAGGNAVFGPSLAKAIADATPIAAPPAANLPEVVIPEGSKEGGKNKNKDNAPVITAAPAAPTAPAFSFQVGLPTGGGGGGFGSGSGITTGAITSPATNFADEAYGSALSNGFGFGVGSGVAINAGGEQAGGSGGATSFGMGNVAFELDDIQTANFANFGTTTSSGGAGAYVGFNPPAARIFGAFITPPPMAGP
jgi:hypothetical protein